ncbi:MAG: hypothetical protein M1837_006965 [Sclerophora amabilis]|nr:MAG: hypothetical protein M1837_006965 [Sclerophora amabilis]
MVISGSSHEPPTLPDQVTHGQVRTGDVAKAAFSSLPRPSTTNLHTSCRYCHHWFNQHTIVLPRYADDVTDVECPVCQGLVLRLGGRGTQASLISQMTIKPDQHPAAPGNPLGPSTIPMRTSSSNLVMHPSMQLAVLPTTERIRAHESMLVEGRTTRQFSWEYFEDGESNS